MSSRILNAFERAKKFARCHYKFNRSNHPSKGRRQRGQAAAHKTDLDWRSWSHTRVANLRTHLEVHTSSSKGTPRGRISASGEWRIQVGSRSVERPRACCWIVVADAIDACGYDSFPSRMHQKAAACSSRAASTCSEAGISVMPPFHPRGATIASRSIVDGPGFHLSAASSGFPFVGEVGKAASESPKPDERDGPSSRWTRSLLAVAKGRE